MAFLQGKTPISFLQELCTKRGCTPQYDLIAHEGVVHQPLFVFRVVAGDFTATGKGCSKKKAKHNAALAVLQKMMGTADVHSSSVVDQLSATVSGGAEDDSLGNPVGELQEMTQKRLWPPPIYSYCNEDGPAHAKEFQCTVKILNVEEKRPGKSKKIAKRNAAHALLKKLREGIALSDDDVTLEEEADEDDEDDHIPLPNDETRGVYSNMRDSKPMSILSSESKAHISQFYRNLHSQAQKSLFDLNGLNLKEKKLDEYIKMLDTIGKEHKFEVTYVDLPEASLTGKMQCLVQLSAYPVAVCCGSGSSRQVARCDAAFNALNYMKTVLNLPRRHDVVSQVSLKSGSAAGEIGGGDAEWEQ